MKSSKLMIQQIGKRNLNSIVLLIAFFITFLLVQNMIVNVTADDDEDDNGDDEFEDLSSSLGWASVGLFVISSLYIVFYQTFRISRKFSDEGNFASLKENIRVVFLKIRKPFLYTHYFAGFFALVTLLIHGILLTRADEEPVAVGWATGAIYIFYILTGIILWLKIKPFWSWKKIRKSLLYVHRSLLLFAIVIIIHIVHLAISD